MKVNFVFFGTDGFSTAVLDELKTAGFLPSLIVTAPDRPKGRGLLLAASPVKEWALAQNLPILQPDKLDALFNLQFATYNPQLAVVASYGLIIPKEALEIPKRGVLNVHPSLLPKYRGSSPIESQILANEKEVGVTVILADEKTDHGPIIAQKKITTPRAENQKGENNQGKRTRIPNASELRQVLAREGGRLLAKTIPKWINGRIAAQPQNHYKTTYTRKFSKKDGKINLSADPYKNYLKILAFDGSIGTYFFHSDGKHSVRVLIKGAEFKDGQLFITRVLPEGRKEMSLKEFLRGLKN